MRVTVGENEVATCAEITKNKQIFIFHKCRECFRIELEELLFTGLSNSSPIIQYEMTIAGRIIKIKADKSEMQSIRNFLLYDKFPHDIRIN